MSKQVDHPVESPEQLLHALTLQMAQQRQQREHTARRRVGVLVGGLVLLTIGTALALFALFSTLKDVGPRRMATQTEPAASE